MFQHALYRELSWLMLSSNTSRKLPAINLSEPGGLVHMSTFSPVLIYYIIVVDNQAVILVDSGNKLFKASRRRLTMLKPPPTENYRASMIFEVDL